LRDIDLACRGADEEQRRSRGGAEEEQRRSRGGAEEEQRRSRGGEEQRRSSIGIRLQSSVHLHLHTLCLSGYRLRTCAAVEDVAIGAV
jgi:hypothetical protein